MAYHINPKTGNPNKCSAVKGNCPFGGHGEHFPLKEDARATYELVMTAPVEDLTPLQKQMRDKFTEVDSDDEGFEPKGKFVFSSVAGKAMAEEIASYGRFVESQANSFNKSNPLKANVYGEAAEKAKAIVENYDWTRASEAQAGFYSLVELQDDFERESYEAVGNGQITESEAWAEVSGSLEPLLDNPKFDFLKI